MALKEVQQMGIRKTEAVVGPLDIAWDRTLHQIEDLVLNYQAHSYAKFPSDAAENIIQKIINNKKISLALIFNTDRTQVTALPLPEVFKGGNRVNLAAHPKSTNGDIESITVDIEAILDGEAVWPTDGALHRVIVIEQNLGEFRDVKELSIGPWNTWGAAHHTMTKLYDAWLRNEEHKLDYSTSGK